MLDRRPLREVAIEFAEERQGVKLVDALDGGQVHAGQVAEGRAHVETRIVRLVLAHLVNSGLGPFFDGVAHLFVTPEEFLVFVAIAFLAGLGGKQLDGTRRGSQGRATWIATRCDDLRHWCRGDARLCRIRAWPGRHRTLAGCNPSHRVGCSVRRLHAVPVMEN